MVFADLMVPLPERVLPIFLEVLRDVCPTLALPFLKAKMQEAGEESVEDLHVRNVLFKLQAAGYVAKDSHYETAVAGPNLKTLQSLCPKEPTLLVKETRTQCMYCAHEALELEPLVSSYDQQMPTGMAYAPTQHATYFRIFTYCAGIQLAAFQPAKCKACCRFYLGGWTFKRFKNHATDCRWVGPCPRRYFVLPKTQSWIGATLDLLDFVSSELLHMPAAFSSVFRVWQSCHLEPRQQELMIGDIGTLQRNNEQRLEDMWFAYQAVTLAEGLDSQVVWDFSNSKTFDLSLSEYQTLLRASHFSSVISHFASCARCQHMVALITDGKYGARRRVCANIDRFVAWPILKISLQSGCVNHAPSNELYCASCSKDIAQFELDQAGTDVSKQTAVLGSKISCAGERPGLIYKVQQADDSVLELDRSKVDTKLLRTFEVSVASRRL